MKKELWLEYGYKQNNFEDMVWYNEGNANEIFYFLKHFIKNIFKKRMYFKMRFYSRRNIYLKKGD